MNHKSIQFVDPKPHYKEKLTRLSQCNFLQFSVCNEPRRLVPPLKGGCFEEDKGVFKYLTQEPSTDDGGDTRRSPGMGRPHTDMSELPTYNTCGQAYNLS